MSMAIFSRRQASRMRSTVHSKIFVMTGGLPGGSGEADKRCSPMFMKFHASSFGTVTRNRFGMTLLLASLAGSSRPFALVAADDPNCFYPELLVIGSRTLFWAAMATLAQLNSAMARSRERDSFCARREGCPRDIVPERARAVLLNKSKVLRRRLVVGCPGMCRRTTR